MIVNYGYHLCSLPLKDKFVRLKVELIVKVDLLMNTIQVMIYMFLVSVGSVWSPCGEE